MAHQGRQVPGRFQRHASQWKIVHHSRRSCAHLLVADLPEFEHCLAEKLLTYALGRGLGPYDRNTVAEIDRKVSQSDYRFQALIREVVHSMPFQMQHGEVILKQSEVQRPKEVASK